MTQREYGTLKPEEVANACTGLLNNFVALHDILEDPSTSGDRIEMAVDALIDDCGGAYDTIVLVTGLLKVTVGIDRLRKLAMVGELYVALDEALSQGDDQ